ncbi:hypothetical protein [Streptomyces acidiscabies]|uniref:hypothetical protein n=1 Tax=Streptomyces acidiscabies TaxID=42234 RepID=UPI00131C21E1|nr:hypothetical protein [Streptomyces acidiscabies]
MSPRLPEAGASAGERREISGPLGESPSPAGTGWEGFPDEILGSGRRAPDPSTRVPDSAGLVESAFGAAPVGRDPWGEKPAGVPGGYGSHGVSPGRRTGTTPGGAGNEGATGDADAGGWPVAPRSRRAGDGAGRRTGADGELHRGGGSPEGRGVRDGRGADGTAGAAAEGHDPGEVTVQLDPLRGGAKSDGEASERPVFVDESGRRSRTFRRLGLAVGLACGAYAAVIAGTLLSGNAGAPWLPLPGPGDDSKPASQVEATRTPSTSEPGAPDGVSTPGGTSSATASGTTTKAPGVTPGPSASGTTGPTPRPSSSAAVSPSAGATGPGAGPGPGVGSGSPSPGGSSPAVSSPPPSSAAPSPDPSPDASASPGVTEKRQTSGAGTSGGGSAGPSAAGASPVSSPVSSGRVTPASEAGGSGSGGAGAGGSGSSGAGSGGVGSGGTGSGGSASGVSGDPGAALAANIDAPESAPGSGAGVFVARKALAAAAPAGSVEGVS